MTDELLTHVLGHVRDALATDGRVGELGLDVVADGAAGTEVVVVRGAVSTDARKQGVVDLCVEVLEAHGCRRTVRDETTVPAHRPPDGPAEVL